MCNRTSKYKVKEQHSLLSRIGKKLRSNNHIENNFAQLLYCSNNLVVLVVHIHLFNDFNKMV